MNPTYPEKHTFNWEEKERLPLFLAIEIFKKQSKSGTSVPRRMTYTAAVQALEDVQHQHDPGSISTKKLKALLIAAAQEHGWYPLDRSKIKQLPDPQVSEGMKFCRRCREVKAKAEFMAVPSPAKARSYGWREDTTQKIVSHLCVSCRKANQQRRARVERKSNVLRHTFTDLQLRENPALATRVDRYHKLHSHLETHAARVRSAFNNAKQTLHLPEGDVYEYQFKTEELRRFYESKRVLVKAARDRLEDMFGEAAPLPDAWGMLLTKEEQTELANLHAEAILSSPSANRTPSLWKAENRKPKETSEE
jgi:hypothetical protein